MIAVLSATENDLYSYPLPIVVWSWYKIGVKSIVFTPESIGERIKLAKNVCEGMASFHTFNCEERKEATYSQTSRLFGATACNDKNEMLITGDSDLVVFGNLFQQLGSDGITVIGADLLSPEMNQYPMCFISMPVKIWENVFCIHGQSLQQALDDTVGMLESINFRGDFWGYDQWLAYKSIKRSGSPVTEIPRAKPGTQFATNRYDRDDAYLLDRLSLDTIDYHMPRPGYTDENFNQILTVLQFHYPNEDFTWLKSYTEEYKRLINE